MFNQECQTLHIAKRITLRLKTGKVLQNSVQLFKFMIF